MDATLFVTRDKTAGACTDVVAMVNSTSMDATSAARRRMTVLLAPTTDFTVTLDWGTPNTLDATRMNVVLLNTPKPVPLPVKVIVACRQHAKISTNGVNLCQ